MAELIRQANDNMLLIALIESAKGLENLSEILAVKGVNAVQIGPQDLSQSLGLPAQLAHPTVQAAIDRIIDEGRAAGKWVSMAAYGSVTVKKQIERGVTITEVMAKDLVVQSGRALLNELRLD
jgi:4-hydroxy-2-oxoheptanedioate aldolase